MEAASPLTNTQFIHSLKYKIFFICIFLGCAFLSGCQSLPSSTSPPTRLTPNTPKPAPSATPEWTTPQNPGPFIVDIVTSTPKPASFPTFQPTQTPELLPAVTFPACLETQGIIEQFSLPSSYSTYPADFHLYTPPCYDPLRNSAYPLLVMIHGQSYTSDQWVRLGISQAADRLIATGESVPFIILMPRDRIWVDPLENPFDENFLNVVLPWVQQNYLVSTDPVQRAIGGLSRGGAWAIHFGARHFSQFGAIGAHSPGIFYSDSLELEQLLAKIPQNTMPRIWIDIGSRDPLIESTLWFEELLTRKSIPHEFSLLQGLHNEPYWESNLEKYLKWYTAPWNTK